MFGLLYVFIPWDSLSTGSRFADIDNYVASVEVLASKGDVGFSDLGFVGIFFAEPAWQLILFFISAAFEDPRRGLLIISWFCIVVYAAHMIRSGLHWAVFLFLLNPLVVDLVMSQTRSALAVALLLIASKIEQRYFRLFLAALATAVHSVVLILLAGYWISKMIRGSTGLLSERQKGILAFVVALVFAFMLTSFRALILGSVGDRRAELDVRSGSILYLAFWMLIAIGLMIAGKRDSGRDGWQKYFCILMLSLPFFMGIFSTQGVRFIALSFPILICVLYFQGSYARWPILGLVATYQLVQYIYWL